MACAEIHRDDFLQALIARDSARARRAVDAAVAGGVAIPDIYVDVLQPALYEVGHRWALGDLNVAHEHYATVIAQSVLDVLSAQRELPPKDGRLAIVTGTPQEEHSLGARMVADFLECDGWEAILLGAGPPVRDIVELVDQERPDVVALSSATAGVLHGVLELIEALAELAPRPLIVAGGQLWTAQTSAAPLELGADMVVRDARELVGCLRERVPPLA
ncbi:cobalamin B12-binding domain-containing protein [Candidatus Solirubrobacter pratensis]|uniref:cobalamin B12-binding domain-containing protein n=1 Tax=Candidatus Solirubrobacter pratensis TaxID=1298857 RepID=UPI00041D5DF6|nr:cobalamin-dependent protein [Candidatus Solirubrobacter pratensis]